jgi:hypothetical protein
MSIVAVHGPNTFGVAGVGGGGTAGAVTNAGGTVTGVLANGMQFTFAGAGDRAVADYDWTFTGGAGAAAQPNVKNGTVTFTDAGAKVITLTLGSTGGTTPAPGTYTYNVTATTAAPRMAARGVEGEEEAYDPGDHTVAEVQEHVNDLDTDEEIRAIYDAEVAGKNRSTLVAYLESLLPFDPAEYNVDDVVEYATNNPTEVDDIIAAERAGKDRKTLLSQLEDLQTT